MVQSKNPLDSRLTVKLEVFVNSLEFMKKETYSTAEMNVVTGNWRSIFFFFKVATRKSQTNSRVCYGERNTDATKQKYGPHFARHTRRRTTRLFAQRLSNYCSGGGF